MGWDTHITVLAENLNTDHEQIAQFIFNQDAKAYAERRSADRFGEFQAFKSEGVLYCFYERRKYMPYWVIQEISEKYPEVYFTLLAGCPDFIGGPAGIARISKGLITDSYGFFDLRRDILEKPNPDLIFNWFGRNNWEQLFRKRYSLPMQWCEEKFADNMIEFQDEEIGKLKEIMEPDGFSRQWRKIGLQS